MNFERKNIKQKTLLIETEKQTLIQNTSKTIINDLYIVFNKYKIYLDSINISNTIYSKNIYKLLSIIAILLENINCLKTNNNDCIITDFILNVQILLKETRECTEILFSNKKDINELIKSSKQTALILLATYKSNINNNNEIKKKELKIKENELTRINNKHNEYINNLNLSKIALETEYIEISNKYFEKDIEYTNIKEKLDNYSKIKQYYRNTISKQLTDYNNKKLQNKKEIEKLQNNLQLFIKKQQYLENYLLEYPLYKLNINIEYYKLLYSIYYYLNKIKASVNSFNYSNNIQEEYNYILLLALITNYKRYNFLNSIVNFNIDFNKKVNIDLLLNSLDIKVQDTINNIINNIDTDNKNIDIDNNSDNDSLIDFNVIDINIIQNNLDVFNNIKQYILKLLGTLNDIIFKNNTYFDNSLLLTGLNDIQNLNNNINDNINNDIQDTKFINLMYLIKNCSKLASYNIETEYNLLNETFLKNKKLLNSIKSKIINCSSRIKELSNIYITTTENKTYFITDKQNIKTLNKKLKSNRIELETIREKKTDLEKKINNTDTIIQENKYTDACLYDIKRCNNRYKKMVQRLEDSQKTLLDTYNNNIKKNNNELIILSNKLETINKLKDLGYYYNSISILNTKLININK